MNKQQQNFLSLSKLECGPQEFNSWTREICLNIRHFQRIGINMTKSEKTLIHFKSDVFAAITVVDAKTPFCLTTVEVDD